MASHDPRQTIEWWIPEQHFRGPADEVAARLDELIVTLVACRETLSTAGDRRPTAAVPASSWSRLFAMLGMTAVLAIVPVGALAQPTAGSTSTNLPWSDVTCGVTLETFYELNANHPSDRVNALRAYDARADTFGIQQIATVIELAPAPAKGRRIGVRLDLQFGQATEAVQGSVTNEPRPQVYRNVWQAYGSYVLPVGRGLQIDAGKFASNLGYETNYAKDDQAFSRALLFTFLPYYHSGLRATFAASDRVVLMATLTNGIQQTEEFNGFKSGQASITLKPLGGVTWTANYYAGREQPDGGRARGQDGLFRIFDTYVSAALGPHVSLGLDVNRTSNQQFAHDPARVLNGLGAYARAQAPAGIAAALRYERLEDDGLFANVDQTLQEATVTLERRMTDGLVVRTEYRHDWSDRPVFPSRDIEVRSRQQTFLVGAIWWFGNKVGAW